MAPGQSALDEVGGVERFGEHQGLACDQLVMQFFAGDGGDHGCGNLSLFEWPVRPAASTKGNVRSSASFEKQIVMMIIITVLNVRDLNLNLLVSFDALMAERNVTRAARRVGLTQSAMSNSLAQLRRVFDDGLFLRHPGGVSPTERALALAGPIRLALSTLDAAFTAQAHFEPGTAERTFTLLASDYVEYVVFARCYVCSSARPLRCTSPFGPGAFTMFHPISKRARSI